MLIFNIIDFLFQRQGHLEFLFKEYIRERNPPDPSLSKSDRQCPAQRPPSQTSARKSWRIMGGHADPWKDIEKHAKNRKNSMFTGQ
jgi:hypothetical protein